MPFTARLPVLLSLFATVACSAAPQPSEGEVVTMHEGDVRVRGIFSSTTSTDQGGVGGAAEVQGNVAAGNKVELKVYRCDKPKAFGAVDHSFIGVEMVVTTPDGTVTTSTNTYGLAEDTDINYFNDNRGNPAQCVLIGTTDSPEGVQTVINTMVNATNDWRDEYSNDVYFVCRQIIGTPVMGKPCTKAARDIQRQVEETLTPSSSQCSFDISTRAGLYFQNCCASCEQQGMAGFDAYYNPIWPNSCSCK